MLVAALEFGVLPVLLTVGLMFLLAVLFLAAAMYVFKKAWDAVFDAEEQARLLAEKASQPTIPPGE